MSRYRVWLRVGGDVSVLEHVAHTLTDLPRQLLRKGDRYGNRVQPVDLHSIELAAWERGGVQCLEDEESILAEERRQLAAAAAGVWQIGRILNRVDRNQVHAELYVSTIRAEDEGGFELPSDLIAAAAAAGLSIGISILVLPDSSE